eukprot:191442_1
MSEVNNDTPVPEVGSEKPVSVELPNRKRAAVAAPEVANLATEELPSISGEALLGLNSNDRDIRQGCLESAVNQLRLSSKLSKSDVKNVAKRLVPAQAATASAVVPSYSRKEGGKRAAKLKNRPREKAIKEDTVKYPLTERNVGSQYQIDIVAARALDKADRDAKKGE